jgi:hypothetical protein
MTDDPMSEVQLIFMGSGKIIAMPPVQIKSVFYYLLVALLD